jgi:coenzyme F420 hydrogenase subunit beta
MKRFGSRELMEQVISKNLCIGCGPPDLCPYFRSYRGKTARLFDCTREEGRCFAYCPKAEVDLDGVSATVFGEPYNAGPLGRFREGFMVRAGRRAPAAAFQSGGAVSALLQCALDTGAMDAAVLTGREGLEAVPRVAATAEEICSCAASKYTAAPTLAALNGRSGGAGRLGVVATPCQTLALAQMKATH